MILLTERAIATAATIYSIYTIMLGYVASQINAYIEEKTHYTIAVPIAFTIICVGMFAPLALWVVVFE